jgi:hypothetical protein
MIPTNMVAAIGVEKARAPLSSPGDDGVAGGEGLSILPIINVVLVLVGLLAAISMYKKLNNSGRRVAPRTPEAALRQKGAVRGAAIGKVPRRFSISGMFGRSGLESSAKLRGRRQLRRARGGRRG